MHTYFLSYMQCIALQDLHANCLRLLFGIFVLNSPHCWQRATGPSLSSSAADLHFKYNANEFGSIPKLHLKYPRCMWSRLKRLSQPAHLVRKGCAVQCSAIFSFSFGFHFVSLHLFDFALAARWRCTL